MRFLFFVLLFTLLSYIKELSSSLSSTNHPSPIDMENLQLIEGGETPTKIMRRQSIGNNAYTEVSHNYSEGIQRTHAVSLGHDRPLSRIDNHDDETFF